MVSVGSKSNSAALVKNLNQNYSDLQKATRRLASGQRINSAGDDPASFILAQSLSNDLSGVNQAIRNIQTDISLLQIVDDALSSNTSLLNYLKQAALRALNADKYDNIIRSTVQEEIRLVLDTMARLNKEVKFGDKSLLTGNFGAVGYTLVPSLEFISATEKTKPTPATGVPIEITQRGTQSFIIAPDELEQDAITSGISFWAAYGGKKAEYITSANDTPETVRTNFQEAIKSAGLDLTVDFSPKNHLLVYHNQYGSKYTFQAGSSVDDLLSNKAGILENATLGVDAAGTIDGMPLIGDGQILKAPSGSKYDGLVLRYSFDNLDLSDSSPLSNSSGNIVLNQNSVYFQVSPYPEGGFRFSLEDLSLDNLGKTAVNDSKFKSLSDINVNSTEAAKSSIQVIDAALQQVIAFRSRVGAAQKQGLETSLAYMQNTKENLSSAVSVINDADYAQEVIDLIRSQLNISAATWAFKKSNQAQSVIVQLLSNDDKQNF